MELEKIVDKLKEGLGERLISVMLYGSVSRGEAKESSDLDVYVIARELPESPIRRSFFLKGLLAGCGVRRRISIRGKTPEEFRGEILPLYLDLATDAQILYDRENFARETLRKIRERIESVGLVRYRTQRGYLGWKLKRPLEKRGTHRG